MEDVKVIQNYKLITENNLKITEVIAKTNYHFVLHPVILADFKGVSVNSLIKCYVVPRKLSKKHFNRMVIC